MNRYATWVAAGALVLVAAGLATGCARSRSVLYSGVGGRAVPDAKALRDVRAVHVQWISEIHRRAREDSGERFANLPARQLRVRLSEAAARYGFTVTKFQLLHPKQLAPVIIIQTRRYLAFARAVPAIEDSLDPHKGHSDQRGWAYEAFFLEAQDERGVPFLGVFNFLRGSEPGGGQWARSDRLYPFVHG